MSAQRELFNDADFDAPADKSTKLDPCVVCDGSGVWPGGPHRYFWAWFKCQACNGTGFATETGGSG